MGSEQGVSDVKICELANYSVSDEYDEREKLALEYAERITITDQDVSDDFFERLRQFFSEDEIVELTATIAWENCSSKFNRALRVDSQNLWKPKADRGSASK